MDNCKFQNQYPPMQIGILSIGTELTSGQILNRNAHWLARKLSDLGLECSVQATVPDQFQTIHEVLDILEKKSDLIFITGGLGPTTDDFTRNVVNAWAKTELYFDQNSWTHLNEQLNKRGVQTKDIHRQECYFPAGAIILKNRVGTANGFRLHVRGKNIFVLPGPPLEIEAIWSDHIKSYLETETKNIDQLIVRKWQTIGRSESDIASLVLAATKDCPFEISYRVHLPYIEVKLSHHQSEANEAQPWIQKIEFALQEQTVFRDQQDPIELLKTKLAEKKSISIFDETTGNYFLERILPAIQTQIRNHSLIYSQQKRQDISYDIQIQKKDENSVIIQCEQKQKNLTSPYHRAELTRRRQQYFAEMAILTWLE